MHNGGRWTGRGGGVVPHQQGRGTVIQLWGRKFGGRKAAMPVLPVVLGMSKILDRHRKQVKYNGVFMFKRHHKVVGGEHVLVHPTGMGQVVGKKGRTWVGRQPCHRWW